MCCAVQLPPVLLATIESRMVTRVVPELVPRAVNYEEMFEHARAVIERRRLAGHGDRVLVTAGVPFDVPGSTNLLKVEVV